MSRKFTDNKGLKWEVKITVGLMRKLRNADVIDLSTLLNDQTALAKLLTNHLDFVDMLWLLCEKQATERDIDGDEFADRIFGDVYFGAQEAFVKAFADFCPSHQAKPLKVMMAKMFKGAREIAAMSEEEMDEKLEAMIEKAQQAAMTEVDLTSTTLSSKLKRSSDFETTVTPSENSTGWPSTD